MRRSSILLTSSPVLLGARLVCVLFGLAMVVLALPWYNAYGQSGCPFPDSVAVADTLDPKGYLPMQVGNLWEYTAMADGFMEDPSREEIIADTLIDGMTFYKLKLTTFDYDFSPVITRSFTAFFYIAVSDTGVVRWKPTGIQPGGPRFSQPFNSCYGADPIWVSGGYGTSFSVMESDSVVVLALPAEKTFTFLGGLGLDTYGHGIGRIRVEGDPNQITELTYARIDGRAFGTPLDSLFTIAVAVEEDPSIPRQPPRLQNYPNPFRAATHLSFSLATPGRVSLRIMDILGRVVAQPLADSPFSSGMHVIAWEADGFPAGMYLAHLIVDGRNSATTKILLIK